MPSPITVFIVTITIDPSNIDEYVRVLKPAYDAVIAEPEHVFFHVLRDQQAEGVLKFVEGWTESIERLMTKQFTKPYYEPYVTLTTAMWTKPRVVEFFTPQEGFQYSAPV